MWNKIILINRTLNISVVVSQQPTSCEANPAFITDPPQHVSLFCEYWADRPFQLISPWPAYFKLWHTYSQMLPAAATAAKLLQSCLTLCDPVDGSPPGSPVLGFSRQEHWSGLPFPSPVHESENESEVAQSCPTLSDPMDCSLSGSSIHGIFQARVLEWGAIAFSKMFPISPLFFFRAFISLSNISHILYVYFLYEGMDLCWVNSPISFFLLCKIISWKESDETNSFT